MVQIDPKLEQLQRLNIPVITEAGDTHGQFVDAQGNDIEGLLYPASSRWGISVGSVWDKDESQKSEYGDPENTGPDQIVGESHRDRTMLDLFAPGYLVTAATLNSGTKDHAGSRLAAAHVAAAVALAQEVNESLYGEQLTFTELDTLLKSTAVTIFDGEEDEELQEFGGKDPTFAHYKRLDVHAMALEIAQPTIDLYFESDWGFSETDEVTGDTTPTFNGTAPAGWHAWLYVNGLLDVSAPVDAMGKYSLTASSQGTGLKDFTVKVAINNTVGDAFRSSSTPLPVEIVASETLISTTAFTVRMNEDLVVTGVNGADSQVEAAWPSPTTRLLNKLGIGTVTIPDPDLQQPIKISDRTVPLTYNAQAGTTVFNINTGTVNNPAASNWTVNVNASNVVFDSVAQNLAALNIGEDGVATIAYTNLPATVPDPPQPIPYKVLHLRHLDIAGTPTAPTGKLDLTNNMLIWNYDGSSSAQAKIRNWIKAGRNGTDINPPWNGNGITSSTAGQHTGLRTVGYADNGELPLGAYTVFYGHSVDNTTVLVRYTIAGDFNLDGVVDDQDVTIISGTYAPTEPNPFFALGDADYSGFIDDADVTLINATYDPLWDIDLHATTQTDG